jgi:hypothetical protein
VSAEYDVEVVERRHLENYEFGSLNRSTHELAHCPIRLCYDGKCSFHAGA